MKKDDVAMHVPQLDPEMVLAAVAWTPGQPVKVALITLNGVLAELDPVVAVELGRSLITTAGQAMEHEAFLEFFTQDMMTKTGGTPALVAEIAQEIVTAYLVWRSKQMSEQYERRRGKQVKAP